MAKKIEQKIQKPKKMALLVAALLLLVLVVICIKSIPLSGENGNFLNYPIDYQEQGLPEYPGATLVDVLTENKEQTKRISIELTTNDSVKKIVEFFRTSLIEKGWTLPPQNEEPGAYYQEIFTGDRGILLFEASNLESTETKIKLIYEFIP